jgi:serine protease DegQ
MVRDRCALGAHRQDSDGTDYAECTQNPEPGTPHPEPGTRPAPSTLNPEPFRVLSHAAYDTPPFWVIPVRFSSATMRNMNNELLSSFSNQLANAVDAAMPAVVQVQGHRRPVSGLVYAENVVLTTARALGRGDGLHARVHDGRVLDAELAGWDPATSLAVLRVPGLGVRPVAPATAPARVGNLAIAIARSWSNAVTASLGIVSVIGGPLQTGRRRSIDQVIRTTAPMHDGFAGGAFVDTDGGLVGVATAAAIRGLGVVIPAGIAWATAAIVLEHGSVKRGYLGVAGQAVGLSDQQAQAHGREKGLLLVGITSGSPAASAGLMVGDVVLDFDGHAVDSPEDLLDLLRGDRVGRSLSLRVLRGGNAIDVDLTVGERPAS